VSQLDLFTIGWLGTDLSAWHCIVMALYCHGIVPTTIYNACKYVTVRCENLVIRAELFWGLICVISVIALFKTETFFKAKPLLVLFGIPKSSEAPFEVESTEGAAFVVQ